MWDDRIAQARREGLVNDASATMARWVTEDFAKLEPSVLEALVAEFASTPVEGYVGCCQFLRDTDITPHLARIKVPTLVIAGGDDPASPVATSEKLRDAVPGAELEAIPAASHLANIEQPLSYNEVLAEFLGTTTSR